jgi:tRNA modification GTPase
LKKQNGNSALPESIFNATYSISCTTGEGLSNLESGLAGELKNFFDELGQGIENDSSTQVFITRERHRTHVKRCIEHLYKFLSNRLPMDIAAEEIRYALDIDSFLIDLFHLYCVVRLAMSELGKITGIVDTEEMLDIIFRDFCIGK